MLWMTALDQIEELRHVFAGAHPEPTLRDFHQRLLLQALETLGWDGAVDEGADLQNLRRRLITELARLGHEPTLTEARRRFEAAMNLNSSMPGTLRRAVLAAVGTVADDAAVDRLMKAMASVSNEGDRWVYFQGLIHVSGDAQINKLLDAAIAGQIPRTQAGSIPRWLAWNAHRGEVVLAHLLRNWAQWKDLVGDSTFGTLPWLLPSAAAHSMDRAMPDRLAAAQTQHVGPAGDSPVAQTNAAMQARQDLKSREVDLISPAIEAMRIER
jgi:hypothetical protein